MTVGVTFLLIPGFYLSWFKNQDNAALWETVSMTIPYLLMYAALFTTFDSMNLIFSFALKGAGDTLCLPRSAHAALADHGSADNLDA